MILVAIAYNNFLQHTYWGGIHYITSGHGCDKNDPLAASYTGLPAAGGLKYAKTVGGFGMIEASKKGLVLSFVDEFGGLLYTTTIKNNYRVH